MQTRRSFLHTAAATAAATLLPRNTMHAFIARQAADAVSAGSAPTHYILFGNWEYLNGSLGGPWEVWHSEETAVWSPVTIPHSFNAYDACDPDTPYYRGNGWYRTHIPIQNFYPNGRTLLHFEGCGQTAQVYVGTQLAGHHKGGYDEFVVDITDLIPAALAEESKSKHPVVGVPISVLCDNSRDLDRMPSDLSDFSLYGGLYRHVNLVYLPQVSLQQLHIRTHVPSPTEPATITIVATPYFSGSAPATEVQATIEISGPDGGFFHTETKSLALTLNPTELTTITIPKPQLWSPSTPNRYNCRVTLTGPGTSPSYTATETFGLKHTEFIQHGPFKLNGERLLLRGTHRHEDHAHYANAMPDALLEEEMRLIKSMGVNFIRLAHYQQSRRVLELCDQLGLLVWEELCWCRGGIGNDVFKQMGRDMLSHMIAQHFNHPSILFWGLGNEDDWPTEYPSVNEPDIRAYMSELNALAHSLDPSRYTSFRRCDFARDIPDVYSPSIWAGWYSGTYPEYQKSLETQRNRVNHLIHIEWGADSHAGRHSETPDKVLSEIATGHGTAETGLAYLSTGGPARVSRDGDWSETYACNLFDWHLKVQETLDWFTGSAQWVFKDFTTPLRVENPVPRINQKGVITRDMQKKESFYVFQSYWTQEPMAHIYGHTWPVRWGDPGEQKMVKVYSNCETAELFLNGKSLGIKHRDSQNFPAAGLRWNTPFVAGTNHLRVVAKKGTATVEDEITFLYQTEKWSTPAKLTLTEKSRTAANDVVTLEAKLYDAHGVLCLDAKNPVRFSLAGPATLIDNLGTPTGSRLVQLYNGRAEISLNRNTATSVAAVTCENLPTATLPIA
ncbi:MAG: glycoside hydrolase family 2 TIM barrel-domain containing protein [Acidobacteriota bacterium]